MQLNLRRISVWDLHSTNYVYLKDHFFNMTINIFSLAPLLYHIIDLVFSLPPEEGAVHI